MLMAELFELESGIEGEKRTDSPATDSRRKGGPVAPIGRLAEQLTDVSTVNRNSASKLRSDLRYTCHPLPAVSFIGTLIGGFKGVNHCDGGVDFDGFAVE